MRTPSTPPSRGRPRNGEHRPDRRNPPIDGPWYRRRLVAELPELPRALAEEADILTLCFVIAQLLPETHDCSVA